MANICGNILSFAGDPQEIKALSKRIKEQDPALLQIMPYFTFNEDYGIHDSDIDSDSNTIFDIYFSSKWNSPLNELTQISEEYPNIEFKIVFDEPSMEYFGSATIQAGSCIETSYSEEEFYENTHDEYINALALLETYSYEEFFNRYTHENFYDSYPISLLDRKVVKKIKDEDLPLFINREWGDEKAKEEYKRRLSESSTVKPK